MRTRDRRRPSTIARKTAACAAVTAALALAPSASAQDVQAPVPGKLDQPSPLGAYAIAILLGGGALALSTMPSGRTHED